MAKENDLCKIIAKKNNSCISPKQNACEGKPFPCDDKEICVPDYQTESFKCNCDSGYPGQPGSITEFNAEFKNFICQKVNNDTFADPKSCYHWLQDGFTSSGLYTIDPDGGKPSVV